MYQVPKDLIPDIRWLARALSKEPTRLAIMHLHVPDDKTIVATDGRRLHILARDHGVPIGNYKIAAKTPMILQPADVTYPKLAQYANLKNPIEYKAVDSAYTAAIFGANGGVLDLQYILDAFPCDKKMTLSILDERSPVVLADDTHKAIIMPKSPTLKATQRL